MKEVRWIGQQQLLLLHTARYNSAIDDPIHFVSNALEESELLGWKTKKIMNALRKLK